MIRRYAVSEMVGGALQESVWHEYESGNTAFFERLTYNDGTGDVRVYASRDVYQYFDSPDDTARSREVHTFRNYLNDEETYA